LSFFAAKAVPLLQLTGEFLGVTLNLVHIIICQVAPPVTNVSSYLKPLALKDLFIHSIPLYMCSPYRPVHLLYQLQRNTRWPERTSALADGTINIGEMGSFTHKKSGLQSG